MIGYRAVHRSLSVSLALGMVCFASVAYAQGGPPTPAPTAKATVPVEGQPPGALPPPQSSHDEKPPVAAPTVTTTGVTTQAGIGGTQAYGRAGVLETGGSAGLTVGSDYTAFRVSPFIGFFFADNIELSLIARLQYTKQGSGPTSRSTTEGIALIEPSYHLPFTQTLFAFLGVGAGVQGQTGAKTGFTIAPRAGLNVLIGRSGVFTPDISLAYTTSKVETDTAGTTLLVLQTSFGFNMGFSVMW